MLVTCIVFVGASVWAIQDSNRGGEVLPAPLPEDGRYWYDVDSIVATYVHLLPELPDLALFEPVLGRTAEGYVPMRPGLPEAERKSLAEIRHEPVEYYSDAAIRSIADQLHAYVTERSAAFGYDAVQVVIDPQQLDHQSGDDLRHRRFKRLRFLVVVDGPTFPISEFRPAYYYEDHPGLPTVDELLATPVTLHRTDQGFVGARIGESPMTTSLAELNSLGTQQYSASAILQVAIALRDAINARDIIGISVTPDPNQIDIATGDLTDLRRGADHLNMVILAGTVEEIRTIASGQRISADERMNHPLHERIAPAVAGEPVSRGR